MNIYLPISGELHVLSFFCKKKFRKGNEEVVICMHMVDKLIKDFNCRLLSVDFLFYLNSVKSQLSKNCCI